jgi:Fe2+ or Zn2+ uptake regulation protein
MRSLLHMACNKLLGGPAIGWSAMTAREGTEQLDEIVDVIRRHGGRVTVPRRAVIAAILDGDGHRSADDIGRAVQADHPDVALSTVYRTLDALQQLGVIEHSHLGHGAAVYHLSDHGHVHLVCRSCGAITDVPDETVADLSARLEQEHGFALAPRHFAMFGTCRSCRPTERAP